MLLCTSFDFARCSLIDRRLLVDWALCAEGGVPPRGVLAVTAIGWECGWWFVRFVVCCCDVCLAFGVWWTLTDDVVTCT